MTANMAGAPSAQTNSLWLCSACDSLICEGGHNHLVAAQVSPLARCVLLQPFSCPLAPLRRSGRPAMAGGTPRRPPRLVRCYLVAVRSRALLLAGRSTCLRSQCRRREWTLVAARR